MNTPNLLGRPTAVVTACLLCLAWGAAQAEEMDIDRIVQAALADADVAMRQAVEFDEASVAFASDEMGSERVVKGAPYCADAVHESVQTLADGNRIVRKQQTKLCRDGEGRTRQEVDRGGRKLVWLRDPVAKQGWLLDPERKTARKLGHFGHAMWFNDAAVEAENAEQWRAFADQAREQAKVMADQARQQVQEARATQERARADARQAHTPQAAQAAQPAQPAQLAQPAQAPQPVLIARPVESSSADARPMELQVLRLNGPLPVQAPVAPGAVMPLPPAPAAVRWQAQQMAPRGAGVQSSLGSKDLEGVRANGERTTWTIEAGKIGNEKPIQIVHEVWTSPDLLLTVQSRDADPRSAERIYRLTNLKRGEPDAGLMKVPSDYSVSGGVASTPAVRKPAAAGSSAKG